MKVYFINSPSKTQINKEGRCMVKKSAWTFTFPPFSLASCAAVIREMGSEVRIIDCVAEGINLMGLKEQVKQYNPDLIILNTSTPTIVDDMEIIDNLKINNPKIRTGVIGIHPTSLPEEVFKMSKGLDYIIRGEPEMILKDLVLAINKKKSLSKIKGLSYRINGKIFHNPPREFIQDLDSLPFPAWDLLNINNYTLPFKEDPFLMVVPSRGCPHNCIFCNAKIYYGNKVRLRSPKRIVDEIEWAKNNFKVKNFHFWTESFTLNRNFALEISKEILKRNVRINWTCNSRVDNVDLELLEFMKKAGCWMISFGIESGDQYILDNAKKGITLEESVNAVKLSKQVGLDVSIQCIIGLPGETKKTALKTITFAKSLNADYAQFYCAVPFPGSDFYYLAKKNKWLTNIDWAKFEQDQSVLNLGNLKAQDIMKLRKMAYISYYTSPRKIYHVFLKFKHNSNFIKFIHRLKSFLSWI